MKIKQGFELRDICGERVVVAEGIENIDFSQIVNLNDTAAYLWENLVGRNFAVADMVNLLIQEYDVTPEQASADCQELARLWIEAGMVDA